MIAKTDELQLVQNNRNTLYYYHWTTLRRKSRNVHHRSLIWSNVCRHQLVQHRILKPRVLMWTGWIACIFLGRVSISCWNIACGICCRAGWASMLGNQVPLSELVWCTTSLLNFPPHIWSSQSLYWWLTRAEMWQANSSGRWHPAMVPRGKSLTSSVLYNQPFCCRCLLRKRCITICLILHLCQQWV